MMRETGIRMVKWIAKALLGEYSAYYIYQSMNGAQVTSKNGLPSSRRVVQVSQREVNSSSESLIQDQAFYLGDGAFAFACYQNDAIAGLCIYWHGERYRKRNFWPLKEKEAKLVQIVTAPGYRGAGIATELIVHSRQYMLMSGFETTYARIWHSNLPSIRAFEKAGWTRRALVLEINPLRRSKPIRITLRA